MTNEKNWELHAVDSLFAGEIMVCPADGVNLETGLVEPTVSLVKLAADGEIGDLGIEKIEAQFSQLMLALRRIQDATRTGIEKIRKSTALSRYKHLLKQNPSWERNSSDRERFSNPAPQENWGAVPHAECLVWDPALNGIGLVSSVKEEPPRKNGNNPHIKLACRFGNELISVELMPGIDGKYFLTTLGDRKIGLSSSPTLFLDIDSLEIQKKD